MIFNQNGFTFSDEIKTVILLNEYAENIGHVFLASKGEYKVFVLFNDKGIPVFESQKFEDMAVHIDIIKMAKE